MTWLKCARTSTHYGCFELKNSLTKSFDLFKDCQRSPQSFHLISITVEVVA